MKARGMQYKTLPLPPPAKKKGEDVQEPGDGYAM